MQYTEAQKEARRSASRRWKARNRQHCNEYAREYLQENPEQKEKQRTRSQGFYLSHTQECSDRMKGWRKENRAGQREYFRSLEAMDPNRRIAEALRSRLRQAINGGYRAGSSVQDLGCSIPELKAHLEARFQPGMTWDNWTVDGWHIDHIKPLDSFDLTDRQQFLQACHYTNLQPLWAEQNLSKGAR